MRRFNIDFLGRRNYMFALSAVLLAISIGALLVRGLTFGIEFSGGTEIDMVNTGAVTIDQVRTAFAEDTVGDYAAQAETQHL